MPKMKITVNEAKAEAKTIAGDISAPVYLYLGESGSGRDRRIKLEGSTILDKLLSLRKAGTYVSIGPAEGSREWARLDGEDQEFYKDLQAKAKKLKTYKAMGDFLSQLCSNNESFLFAIRQGDDAVWVNPHILKELLDTPWHGVDSYWLDQAADTKGYWDKVVAARDAGKDYSKIKPESKKNEAAGFPVDGDTLKTKSQLADTFIHSISNDIDKYFSGKTSKYFKYDEIEIMRQIMASVYEYAQRTCELDGRPCNLETLKQVIKDAYDSNYTGK